MIPKQNNINVKANTHTKTTKNKSKITFNKIMQAINYNLIKVKIHLYFYLKNLSKCLIMTNKKSKLAVQSK